MRGTTALTRRLFLAVVAAAVMVLAAALLADDKNLPQRQTRSFQAQKNVDQHHVSNTTVFAPQVPSSKPVPVESSGAETNQGFATSIPVTSLLRERRYIIYVLHTPENGDLAKMGRYMMTFEARMREARQYFWGWKVRVYMCASFSDEFAKAVQDVGMEVVRLGRLDQMPTLERMGQRLLVLEDENVDRFLIRDLDSTLGYRDFVTTMHWIQSGKAAACAHDHQAHHDFMGGMWSGVRVRVRQLLGRSAMELLEEYKADKAHRSSLKYDDDQGFLNKMIAPRLKGDILHYDSFQTYCKHSEPDCIPFPLEPQHDDQRHMGKRAYTNDHGPLTETSQMQAYPCQGWSNRLAGMRVFAAEEWQSKWPAAFETFRKRCRG